MDSKVSAENDIKESAKQLVRMLAAKCRGRTTQILIERKLFGYEGMGYLALNIGYYGELSILEPGARSAPQTIDLDTIEPSVLLKIAIELA